MTGRLIQLQDARLRLQNRITELQGLGIDKLSESGVDPESVVPDIQRIRSMSRQLVILSDQAFSVSRRLGPPRLWPPDARQHIKMLVERFREGAPALRESRRDLAKAWKNVAPEGDPGLGEDADALSGNEDGSEGFSDGLPQTEDGAGEVILKGGVQEAKNLLEVFMHVPESTTPKAKLDYYRKLRERRTFRSSSYSNAKETTDADSETTDVVTETTVSDVLGSSGN